MGGKEKQWLTYGCKPTIYYHKSVIKSDWNSLFHTWKTKSSRKMQRVTLEEPSPSMSVCQVWSSGSHLLAIPPLRTPCTKETPAVTIEFHIMCRFQTKFSSERVEISNLSPPTTAHCSPWNTVRAGIEDHRGFAVGRGNQENFQGSLGPALWFYFPQCMMGTQFCYFLLF